MKFGLFKFSLSLFFTIFIRFFKFIPNNDPIMAFLLPFSRKTNWKTTILFPLLAMIVFDIITFSLGLWTIVTALTYSLVGIVFRIFFKKQSNYSIKKYALFGTMGILIFDFITGPIMSSFLFKMSFEQAFLGQIPFTFLHLITVNIYIILLVPLIEVFIFDNPSLTDSEVNFRLAKFIKFIGD